jgi:hypothetical protein
MTRGAVGSSWISSVELGLDENLAVEWDNFRQSLIESGISLVDRQDELIWTGGDMSGHISVKNVYEALSNKLWRFKLGAGGENLEVGLPFEDKAFCLAFS